MPRILIPDAESRHTLNVMHCLACQKDMEIFILSSKKGAYCKFSKYCKGFIFHDLDKGRDEFLNLVLKLIDKHKIDFLFPVDTEGIRWVAEHATCFNGICEIAQIPDTGHLRKVVDKWNFFLSLKNEGIRTPKTERFDGKTSLPPPTILKPRKGESGTGIYLLNAKEELDSLKLIEDNYIIQEFIDGHDIDCSFLAREGELLAYTIQKPIRKKGKASDFAPSKDIEICHEERVIEIIEILVQKMKWSGVAHADLRYCHSTNDFYLIEINPRYWSSLLGSLAAGVNFPLLALQPKQEKTEYKEVFYYGVKSKLRSLINHKGINKPIASTLRHVLIDPMPFVVNKLAKL